jgi:hypothetical protein
MARHFVASSSQYLQRLGVPVSAAPLTLAIWAKPSAATPGVFAGTICNAATNGWFTAGCNGASPTPARAYHYDNATAGIADSTVNLVANTWTHICAVFTSNTARAAYLNGAAKGTNATTMTTPALDRVMVGAGYFGGALFSPWDGDLAEFAIWNVALSDSEVAQLATGGTGGIGLAATLVRPGNLLAYFPILGTSSPEPDTMGGAGLTLVNGPTSATHPPIQGASPAGGRMFAVF